MIDFSFEKRKNFPFNLISYLGHLEMTLSAPSTLTLILVLMVTETKCQLIKLTYH
jgi:hypothetical protein